MSPILDFSNAASWVAGGFIAGLLVYWLFLSLFGGAGRNSAEFFKISTQLDAATEQLDAAKVRLSALRGDSESHAAKATYYEGEYTKLFATAQALSQDTGEVSRLTNDLIAARKEIQNLHAEAKEGAGKVEKTYKDKYDSEVLSLTTELRAAQNESGQASLLKSEVRRLTNEMSSAALELQAGVEEKIRLGAEVARLTAALSSAYADLRRTLVEFHTAKHDLQQAKKNLEETSVVVSRAHRPGFLDSRVCDLG